MSTVLVGAGGLASASSTGTLLDILTPVIILVIGADWVFAATYYQLYRRDGEPHLRMWSASYVAFSIGNLALYTYQVWELAAWLPLLSALMVLTAASALVWGTDRYVERRGYRLFLPIALGAAAVAFGLQLAGQPFTVVMALPGVTLAGAFAYAGYSLLWHSPERGIGVLLAGVAAWLQGLNGLTFPFAVGDAFWLGVGTAVSVVISIAMGMGLLLLHVDRARHQTAKSRDAYEDLVGRASVGICRTALDGQILAANPALVAMLGYDAIDEVLALNVVKDVYASGDATSADLEHHCAGDRNPDGVEVEWTRKDGSSIYVAINGWRITDEHGATTHHEAFVRDVTRTRILEERVRHSEKMEAVGRLAGGVAHDFNNYLTVIMGSASELQEGATPSGEALISEMLTASKRALGLTNQLLAFSRRQPRSPKNWDVNVIVDDAAKMLGRLVQEDIRIRVDLAPVAACAHVDRNQLEQALLNLAANARDAMPRGGQLTIATKVAHETVVIEVDDDGEGMDPATLARAFEPFFTTKGVGEGTGLGLASVFGIVEQSSGHISAESEPGRGTRFRIELPRVADQPKDLAGPRRVQRAANAGGAVILVVEDEPLVRRVLDRTLSRAGHQVVLATGKDEINEALKEALAPDLLITDVVMPHISGLEVAAHVRQAVPEIPVLFVSGYPDRAAEVAKLEGANNVFLSKPFTGSELLAEVAKILMDRSALTAANSR